MKNKIYIGSINTENIKYMTITQSCANNPKVPAPLFERYYLISDEYHSQDLGWGDKSLDTLQLARSIYKDLYEKENLHSEEYKYLFDILSKKDIHSSVLLFEEDLVKQQETKRGNLLKRRKSIVLDL